MRKPDVRTVTRRNQDLRFHVDARFTSGNEFMQFEVERFIICSITVLNSDKPDRTACTHRGSEFCRLKYRHCGAPAATSRLWFSQRLAVREFHSVAVRVANEAQITGIRVQKCRTEL